MPWTECSSMSELVKFIAQYEAGDDSFARLCRRFGISRKTGYKWVERWEAEGADGLKPRSRAPRNCPWAVSQALEEAIVGVRGRHPTWGAKKILAWLERKHPGMELCAASTASQVLSRRGLVPSGQRPAVRSSDDHRRAHAVRPAVPGAVGGHGLRRGEADLRGRVRRVRPAHADTTMPPAHTLRAQQRRFDAWRREFNEERPHEALEMRTPGSLYTRSVRRLAARPAAWTYGDDFEEERKVKPSGQIKWRGKTLRVSHALHGRTVGLKSLGRGYWQVWFRHLLLGVLDEKQCRIIRPGRRMQAILNSRKKEE